MSLAVNLMTPVEASISIHSKIDIVVLEGTALDTIFTPCDKLDFEQISFIMNNSLQIKNSKLAL